MMRMDYRRTPEPEHPRCEPEIIPPHHTYRRSTSDARIWVSHGYHGVYIVKPSPLAIILAVLVLGGVALGLLAVVVGAFLLLLPVIGVLVLSFVLAGLFRGHAGRLR
jgi:hypothetical protein